jgi:hypothetical protein
MTGFRKCGEAEGAVTHGDAPLKPLNVVYWSSKKKTSYPGGKT